ncbi:MAG TPA: hypothetical protein ENH08_01225, partial [Chromatiales bacterium]|nr:hypothetical protein [Chromatiales bacterium]
MPPFPQPDDDIHDFSKGIRIVAAFLADFQFGVVAALAVTAHEIPQESSDFVALLHSDVRPRPGPGVQPAG